LTGACCPKRDFYTHTHPSPKNSNRLLCCILKIARLLYCVLKKSTPKSRPKKVSQKNWPIKVGPKSGIKGGKKGGEKVYS